MNKIFYGKGSIRNLIVNAIGAFSIPTIIISLYYIF